MQLYFGTPITRYFFLDLQIYNSGTLEMAVEDIRNRSQKPVSCQHASHKQSEDWKKGLFIISTFKKICFVKYTGLAHNIYLHASIR